jgi:hypothetical protein
MGCSTCGRSQALSTGSPFPTQYNATAAQIISTGPCPYTKDQLMLWQQKLQCFLERGYYRQYNIPASSLNKALGDVLSSINYPNDPCYYKRQLDAAQNLILFIISTNQC